MILSNLLRRMAGHHWRVYQVFQTCQREKGQGSCDNLRISPHGVSSLEIWVPKSGQSPKSLTAMFVRSQGHKAKLGRGSRLLSYLDNNVMVITLDTMIKVLLLICTVISDTPL